LEIQIFEPLSRYPPSAGTARVRIAAASDPACGSVRAKAPSAAPESIGGSHSAFCSADPHVSTGYCDRIWTDKVMADAMSAAPISSITSVQPTYEKPAPPSASANGAAVRPRAPMPAKIERSNRSDSSRSMADGAISRAANSRTVSRRRRSSSVSGQLSGRSSTRGDGRNDR
jgi:hypothetical protein